MFVMEPFSHSSILAHLTGLGGISFQPLQGMPLVETILEQSGPLEFVLA